MERALDSLNAHGDIRDAALEGRGESVSRECEKLARFEPAQRHRVQFILVQHAVRRGVVIAQRIRRTPLKLENLRHGAHTK